MTIDRPREIRVWHTEPAPKPVEGARRALVSLSLLGLLVAACAALLFAFRSDRFKISEISVNGASPALIDRIAAAVGSSCRDRKTTGVSVTVRCNPFDPLLPGILAFNTAELRQEFEHIPAVKTATVRALLPNRLVVSVVERQPEAALIAGASTFRVAEDGMVLDQAPIQGLKVVIESADGPAPKPGDRVDPQVIKGAEELQNRLPKEAGIPIKHIQYSAGSGLAVIFDPNAVAIFGSSDNLGLKMAELQRILQLAKDKKTTPVFVDLRYKTPYYRTG